MTISPLRDFYMPRDGQYITLKQNGRFSYNEISAQYLGNNEFVIENPFEIDSEERCKTIHVTREYLYERKFTTWTDDVPFNSWIEFWAATPWEDYPIIAIKRDSVTGPFHVEYATRRKTSDGNDIYLNREGKDVTELIKSYEYWCAWPEQYGDFDMSAGRLPFRYLAAFTDSQLFPEVYADYVEYERF